MEIKKCTKNAQIWSVKYTKFDNFSKKYVAMVDLMSRHYLVSRIKFLKYFSISLHSIIAVKVYFHNCGLFLVWSANYGHFEYQERTPFWLNCLILWMGSIYWPKECIKTNISLYAHYILPTTTYMQFWHILVLKLSKLSHFCKLMWLFSPECMLFLTFKL